MSKFVTKVLTAGAAISLLALPGVAPAQAAAEEGTRVQLLNITDFHGRIVEAGAQVASVVESERADFATQDKAAGTAFLSAGDNIGASTYVSSSQNDSPTIDVLNAMGLQASSVGNHEFDQGVDDLTGRVSQEADFPFLAANVYEKGTNNVADGLDEYTTLDIGGVKVAVIGVVTRDTTSLVAPDGIANLDFGDPTDAVNRVAKDIEALPEADKPDMTVVEGHLGASTTTNLDDALASNKEFNKLVTEADASIDALFTGHTHLPYVFEAPVPGESDRTRPVLEAGNYGSVVGQVQLTQDAEGNWTTDKAELIDTEDKDFDSPVVDEVKQIVADADEKAKVPGSVVAGEITEDITRATTVNDKGETVEDRGGESTLGNLVADALKSGVEDSQLKEADFGITNPGGLRTDLKCDDIYNTEKECEVTAAELSAVLPFANDHGVVTMKGADVIGLFEEQWQPAGGSRPFLHLGISKELDVVYDSKGEAGDRVKSVKVNGEEIDPNKDYRVATLSFLAAGGDNFTSFTKGEFELSGLTDFETWVKYFNKNTPVEPDKSERQADVIHDVIENGKMKAELVAPAKGIAAGESAEFLLKTTAEAEVPGPIDVKVDLPDGYTVNSVKPASAQSKTSADEAEDGKVQGSKTIVLDSIPAGESEYAVNVTAPKDAKDSVKASASLVAGESEWWNDNPLPLSHEFTATAKVVAGAGTSDDNGAADGSDGSDGSADGADGSGAASDSSSSAEGDDANSNGSNAYASKDGGDLPRTGFETMSALAAALALIAAGSGAVATVRRRRNTVDH